MYLGWPPWKSLVNPPFMCYLYPRISFYPIKSIKIHDIDMPMIYPLYPMMPSSYPQLCHDASMSPRPGHHAADAYGGSPLPGSWWHLAANHGCLRGGTQSLGGIARMGMGWGTTVAQMGHLGNGWYPQLYTWHIIFTRFYMRWSGLYMDYKPLSWMHIQVGMAFWQERFFGMVKLRLLKPLAWLIWLHAAKLPSLPGVSTRQLPGKPDSGQR